MITYTVRYKTRGSCLWKKIKNVIGDGYVDTRNIRFFLISDYSRVEIPATETLFIFSKERHFSIKEKMEEESGTRIVTKN